MITPEIFTKLSQHGFAETFPRRLSKQAMLESLTKDELKTLAIERSWDWCGFNWESKDEYRIKQILESRAPADQPLLNKISR